MIGSYTVIQSLHTVHYKRYSYIGVLSQYNPYPNLGSRKKFSLSKYLCIYPTLFLKPEDSKNNLYIVFYDSFTSRYLEDSPIFVDGKEFLCKVLGMMFACYYEAELTSDGFKLYLGRNREVCLHICKNESYKKYIVRSIEINGEDITVYLAYFSVLMNMLIEDKYGLQEELFGDTRPGEVKKFYLSDVINYIDYEYIKELPFKVIYIVQCDDFISMNMRYEGCKSYVPIYFSFYKGRYVLLSGYVCTIIFDIKEKRFWYVDIESESFDKTLDGVCTNNYEIRFNNGIEVEKKEDIVYYYDVKGSYEARYKLNLYAPFGIPLNMVKIESSYVFNRFIRMLRVLPIPDISFYNQYYGKYVGDEENNKEYNELNESVIYDYVPPLVTCVLKNE